MSEIPNPDDPLARPLTIGKDANKSEKVLKALNGFVDTIRKNATKLKEAALSAAGYTNFLGGISESFAGIGEEATSLGLTVGEGFTNMTDDIESAMVNLQDEAEIVGLWIGDIYDNVKTKDWDGLSDNVSTGLSTVWDGVVGFFSDEELMTDIGAFFASIVNGIADFLSELEAEDLIAIFDGIRTGLKSFIDNIDWGDVFEGILTAFKALGLAIVQMIMGLITDVVFRGVDSGGGIGDIFGAVIGSVF